VIDYEPSPVGARLVFVALRVRDLEASARFYRDAFGIPLRAAGGSDEETHYEYSWRDGAYLHFALFPAAPGEQSRRAEVAFFVDDVDVAHARAVASGADVTAAPHSEPWGRTAGYRDPDGNAVGLTQRPGGSLSARFRLQIGVIPRCEQSFGTPRACEAPRHPMIRPHLSSAVADR